MTWRDVFIDHFAPGYLGGITLGKWLHLLRENRFQVGPSSAVRALSTTMLAPSNSVLRLLEALRHGSAVNSVAVAPPLFVLGHWRSGTTHLQQLLASDQRFASPTLYQVFFPHTFLSTERLNASGMQFFLPRTRGFDNVRQTIQMPHEDEIAICMMSGCTPYLSLAFPRRTEFYDRFLTFRRADDSERERWADDLIWFAKKLTYRYRKPLILKSPPHTCRISLLLDMFPGAKFVHIHRDPFDVYQSTMRLLGRGLRITRLQRVGDCDWSARTLRLYREMYDTFFEERYLIPKGHFCEVAFKDVELDPIGQLQKIYRELSLPGFDECEQATRGYLAEVGDYKRNRFPDLTPTLREKIQEHWQPSFAAWGYPT